MTRWASSAIGTIDGNYLQSLRLQSPVSVIATARDALSLRPTNAWSAIDSERALDDFDQVPLTSRGGKRIEGVFIRGQGRVALNADMFMAADASLLSFVETADQQRFRFLLADGEVSGLVTLSDLQKLPVYALLFGLVIAVEMLLMECMTCTLPT